MTLRETASASELAKLFTEWSALSATGARDIDVRQVNRWHERQRNNKFPDPLEEREFRGRFRHCKVWDIGIALDWFLTYVPAKGGAPPASRNHGTYLADRT
jgi:hypothetical protein